MADQGRPAHTDRVLQRAQTILQAHSRTTSVAVTRLITQERHTNVVLLKDASKAKGVYVPHSVAKIAAEAVVAAKSKLNTFPAEQRKALPHQFNDRVFRMQRGGGQLPASVAHHEMDLALIQLIHDTGTMHTPSPESVSLGPATQWTLQHLLLLAGENRMSAASQAKLCASFAALAHVALVWAETDPHAPAMAFVARLLADAALNLSKPMS